MVNTLRLTSSWDCSMVNTLRLTSSWDCSMVKTLRLISSWDCSIAIMFRLKSPCILASVFQVLHSLFHGRALSTPV